MGSHLPAPAQGRDDLGRVRALYLDAMERILCNTIYGDPSSIPGGGEAAYHGPHRDEGRDWPTRALSMIGRRRMHQLRGCVEQVIADGIRGDLIETGVWRGGAAIMMRAVLEAYGAADRTVWVADSFRGLPPPNAARYPADAGLHFEGFSELAIPLDVVRENFRSFDLLDDAVRFVEGWFADTLAHVPATAFAIIRLDGDLYESTMDALTALYPKLVPGGFAIVDDYGAIPACREAVEDYRRDHRITAAVTEIDWSGVFWRKI